MPRPTQGEELRWKRALLETIGAAMRGEASGAGDPALLAKIGNLMHNSADELQPVALPVPDALPASLHLESSGGYDGAGARGPTGGRRRRWRGREDEAPPPFTNALLDSAEIYLSEQSFADALRFARVAAVTAVQEPQISEESQRRLHEALRMIVRIAHAAGTAGVDVQLDG
jgi:hypothetical protein